MSIVADLTERLRALFFRRRLDGELDEELLDHLEREVTARVRRGEDPAAARREALLVLGGVERTKEEVRDARGVQPLLDAAADVRHATRTLAHNPGFTMAAVLVLGLGIGAATAVFSVVRGVLWSDLPYEGSGRLVRLFTRNPQMVFWQLSTVDAQAIADQQRSFQAFGVVALGEVALSGAGTPLRVPVVAAQSGFFQALGVGAAAGRLIEPGDEVPGAPLVMVVTHAFAEQSLGGDRAALGRTLTIDGMPCTIVGVLPQGRGDLAGMRAPLWPALRLDTPRRRGPFWLRGFARLRPGVSLEQARRDVAAITEHIYPLWASGYQDSTARYDAMPLRQAMVGDADKQLDLFAGAVLLVLLIAVANVATLMLVRASAREHELNVRAALGAGRGRLARLLIAESLMVTALAGLLGVALASFGVANLGAVAPRLPRASDVALGLPGVLFAAAAVLVSGVLIGVTPVVSVLGRRLRSLSSSAGRVGQGRHTTRVRNALVTMEFALALPLLLGAGVLLNSLLRLENVNPGYDSRNVFLVRLALPAMRYHDSLTVVRFLNSAVQRAEATPGVLAAGLATDLPPDNGGDLNNFNLPDHPVAPGHTEPVVPWSLVSPGYFRTLGIPLLTGRLFDARDSATAPGVAIVSRSWADRWFPGESPVGRRIISGGCYACPPTTIVGVVGDVKYQGLAGDGQGAYSAVSQAAPTYLTLVVRAAVVPGLVFPQLRRALAALDPELPLPMQSMSERIADSIADPRRWTSILSAFAATAAVLAAIGIFGLMSFVVRQRRREIGVRIALGAEPGAVAWMIVARGMRFAGAGILLGLALAALEARWLRALLYQVAPTDPLTLAAVAVALASLALAACWGPALRASRIRPLEALAAP